jgi:hypothetical protein
MAFCRLAGQDVAEEFLQVVYEVVVLREDGVQKLKEHRAVAARSNGGFFRNIIERPMLAQLAGSQFDGAIWRVSQGSASH